MPEDVVALRLKNGVYFVTGNKRTIKVNSLEGRIFTGEEPRVKSLGSKVLNWPPAYRVLIKVLVSSELGDTTWIGQVMPVHNDSDAVVNICGYVPSPVQWTREGKTWTSRDSLMDYAYNIWETYPIDYYGTGEDGPFHPNNIFNGINIYIFYKDSTHYLNDWEEDSMRVDSIYIKGFGTNIVWIDSILPRIGIDPDSVNLGDLPYSSIGIAGGTWGPSTEVEYDYINNTDTERYIDKGLARIDSTIDNDGHLPWWELFAETKAGTGGTETWYRGIYSSGFGGSWFPNGVDLANFRIQVKEEVARKWLKEYYSSEVATWIVGWDVDVDSLLTPSRDAIQGRRLTI